MTREDKERYAAKLQAVAEWFRDCKTLTLENLPTGLITALESTAAFLRSPESNAKKQVICAAIKLKSGEIIRGHRHDFCFFYALRLKNSDVRSAEQGFITSENKFVNRKEAMRIQKAAGIESIEGYRGDILFSEDLY